MVLRLCVGVSRKVGMPAYSSIGATCHIEFEVDAHLLQTNPESFQEQLRSAYALARNAVDDELERLRAVPAEHAVAAAPREPDVNAAATHFHGQTPGTNGACGQTRRTATPAQVKAIGALARSRHFDLKRLLRDRYGVEAPDELTVREASRLIGEIRVCSES